MEPTTKIDLPIPFFARGTWIRQNVPRDLGVGTYIDHELPEGTLEVWQGAERIGRIENIGIDRRGVPPFPTEQEAKLIQAIARMERAERRVAELEAIQVKFEGSNLSRLVDAYDEFKKGLEDVIAIEERQNRGDAETATRAKEALQRDYTPVFDRK